MPEVPEYLEHYWEAFTRLSRRRVDNGGIPHTEMVSWMNENNYDTDNEREDFLNVLDELDGMLIQHYHDKAAKERKKNS
jgi:hypothetical protein